MAEFVRRRVFSYLHSAISPQNTHNTGPLNNAFYPYWHLYHLIWFQNIVYCNKIEILTAEDRQERETANHRLVDTNPSHCSMGATIFYHHFFNSFISERKLSLLMETHAVCRWGSSWPGSAECLRRRCRDTGVCTAGWVCRVHPTNTPHTQHCCHWSHRQQPWKRKTDFSRSLIYLYYYCCVASDATKEEQTGKALVSSDIYLWFLAVVFVLYPIDLLQ